MRSKLQSIIHFKSSIFKVIAFNIVSSFIAFSCCAQSTGNYSVHQEFQEYFNAIGMDGADYEHSREDKAIRSDKSTQACNLNKVVFGWHPYWSNGLEGNYDWNLLSDLSYFSYEVNASTGQANTTHSWATANVVTQALANGVRVNLCVTLFSSHATFFGSSTAQQTLIDNLISLVQSRGAHGVNIDFEGVPISQKTNLTNFLIALCDQMHTQIPGSQVSICLYAVDWNGVFEMAILDNYIDYFVIMGYAYYYSQSTNAGPSDPLYHFGSTYNYTLSKSITYYLNEGANPDKLILGLPYYGIEYGTASTTIPTSVLNPPNSTNRFYNSVKTNTSGNFSMANKVWVEDTQIPAYVYQSGGEWRQCFINDVYSMSKRFDIVNQRGIGGIGIWALGFDDPYPDLWNLIEEKFTDCAIVPCSDTIYDMGGPLKNYYSNEDYTYTIQPANSMRVTLNFTSFDVEAGSGASCNFDYLEIFDGPDTSFQSLGRFCNTTGSPGTILSTGNALTLMFHSDGATVNAGFTAVWTCNMDTIPPITSISSEGWKTEDFVINFTDSDNEAVDLKMYQVSDFNGTEWRANGELGFLNDNFNSAIHPDWISSVGTWVVNSGQLNQADEVESNTNLYIPLVQQTGNTYMYEWDMKISGSGTNRRAGLHFFCDDPSLTQRGNSYMVYFRVDQDKCQIYRSDNNSIVIKTDDACGVDLNTLYHYKVLFNTVSGEIKAFQNDVLVSSWTDPNPFTAANSFSLRTGQCNVYYDDVKVFKSRSASENISVGVQDKAVRYQNPNPETPSCKVISIISDAIGNFSNEESVLINIDWTSADPVSGVYDGLLADADTTSDTTDVSGSWESSIDPHSGLVNYLYSVGISPGDSSVVGWTIGTTATSALISGLTLYYGTTYYFNVKGVNGAGLVSALTSSDGILLLDPVSLTAMFSFSESTICSGDSVYFANLSSGATSFEWNLEGADLPTSTQENPIATYNNPGVYDVSLIISDGVSFDTASQSQVITVEALPQASFILDTAFGSPPMFVLFTNTSQNANSYSWNFGDGGVSTDGNPYHIYNDTGIFYISLIAYSDNCPSDTLSNGAQVSVTYPNSWIALTNTESNVVVYPNPFNDAISIRSSKFGMDNLVIKLVNSMGETIYRSKLVSGGRRPIEMIFTDGLEIHPGIYFLIVTDEQGNESYTKLVKATSSNH